jgi:hypothetical protein
LALERELLEARVTGDVSAIRKGFAADSVYVQDSGETWTRAGYLEAAARAPRWIGFEEIEQQVSLYGDAAVTHAVVLIRTDAQHTDRKRTTVVYVRQSGRWRVVSWQATPTAAPK